MSFEGYYQVLCRNGHSHQVDVYSGDEFVFDAKPSNLETVRSGQDYSSNLPVYKCNACGEVVGWWNLVDDTNCDQAGLIALDEVKPAQYQTCNLGHEHTIEEAIYRPSESGGHFINGGLK